MKKYIKYQTGYATFSALILAVGIAISGIAIGYALAHFKGFDRYVTVKGLAQDKVKADEAIWKLNFSNSSDELATLYKEIERAQQQVKNFLVNQGFSPDAIQFQQIVVTDNQSETYSSNDKAKRYKVVAGVVLTTNKINAVGHAIQKAGELVQQGVILNQSNVKYIYTQLNLIKPKMLIDATSSAEKAANTFAKNSNSQLSGIRQASQGLFTISNADGSYGSGDPWKKVRVVTTVQYFLKK